MEVIHTVPSLSLLLHGSALTCRSHVLHGRWLYVSPSRAARPTAFLPGPFVFFFRKYGGGMG
jgi:hypothetical protein